MVSVYLFESKGRVLSNHLQRMSNSLRRVGGTAIKDLFPWLLLKGCSQNACFPESAKLIGTRLALAGSMAIVFVCWAVLSTLFALALFRAAARPIPRADEQILPEVEQAELPGIAPRLEKPSRLPKARPEALATSYTTL